MKLVNTQLGLSAEIDDVLIERIKQTAQVHYPKEFGGVLVGRYSADRTCVSITDMILPKKYSSTRYTFDRGTEGLKEELEAFFDMEPSKIYIGEWHTHPDAAPIPSATDISALRQIVSSDTVHIASPVMIIVGIGKDHFEMSLYLFFKEKLYQYDIMANSSNNNH